MPAVHPSHTVQRRPICKHLLNCRSGGPLQDFRYLHWDGEGASGKARQRCAESCTQRDTTAPGRQAGRRAGVDAARTANWHPKPKVPVFGKDRRVKPLSPQSAHEVYQGLLGQAIECGKASRQAAPHRCKSVPCGKWTGQAGPHSCGIVAAQCMSGLPAPKLFFRRQ